MKVLKEMESSINRNYRVMRNSKKHILEESMIEDRKEKRRNTYKKYAQVETIDRDHLDDWAIRRTCREHNFPEDRLREELSESIINEATATLGDAARQASAEIKNDTVVTKKTQIEIVLDRALELNEEQHELGKRNFQNILLIGEAGVGKSSIIRQWAKDNDINLFEVRAAGMDETDLGGIVSKGEGTYSGVARRLATTEFDVLDRPRSVLFLDEYNRAPKGVRTNLLELVNSHLIPDSRIVGGQRYLPNFLFTIAAINPPTANYDVDELDMAERTRFRNIDITPNPADLLRHLTKELQDQADRASSDVRRKRALGRLQLAQTLLKDKTFEFDSSEDIAKSRENGNGLALNYRTFTNLLLGSDGTKEDFLNSWNEYTNNLKKSMAERILSKYQDIDDKATDALKYNTTSPVFKKEVSNWDKIAKALDEVD